MKVNRKEGKDRIHVLDEETINKIAAGEVVERPASVVKELVENSIDAGARAIRVEITADTREVTGISVSDDGIGMARDDAILSFTRHATSKITDIDDLKSLHTMGFRGEALASIAAVSRLTMVTKSRDSGMQPGTHLSILGGEIQSVRETGVPEGTRIHVEDLFFNTPARKKFVKSRETEIRHIYSTMEHIALAHSDIAFSVTFNGRERLMTYATGDLRATITAIHGNRLTGSLVPVRCCHAYMVVEGYIATPEESRPNANQVMLSINHRQISSPPITRAVRQGYGTLLPKDRHPVAFLHLTIDTALVDVNVHPTKREVRFSREREILADITSCIKNALSEQSLISEVSEPVRTRDTTLPLGGYTPSPGAMRVEAPGAAYQPIHQSLSRTDSRLRITEQASIAAPEAGTIPPLTVIGQVDASYIIAKARKDGNEELVIIDQHAAHERILYEQVMEKRKGGNRSQELIVPVILSLSAHEAAAVRESLHLLMAEGFVLEEFGKDTFAVRTVPVVLGSQLEAAVVHDIISDITGEELHSSNDRKEKITTIIACRGAIKANTVLTDEQMNRLVNQLRRTNLPFTCPHGRPTMITFSRSRLDTMFKRT